MCLVSRVPLNELASSDPIYFLPSLPPLFLWDVGGLAVKSVATLMLQAQQLWDGVLPKLWLSEWSFQKASKRPLVEGEIHMLFGQGKTSGPQ